jgi:GMP synthase-like glutamine amidotransferase
VPHLVRDAEAGQYFPESIDGFAPLAILGGEMRANVALPAPRRAQTLIHDAMHRGRPLIGHCPGGQSMARAVGAGVRASSVPEIGWQPLTVATHDTARHCFGQGGPRQVFQWHGESFELRVGAASLAGSAACTHQTFAIGPHRPCQLHVKSDAPTLRHVSMLDTARYRRLQRRFASWYGDVLAAGPAAERPASAGRSLPCTLVVASARRRLSVFRIAQFIFHITANNLAALQHRFSSLRYGFHIMAHGSQVIDFPKL